MMTQMVLQCFFRAQYKESGNPYSRAAFPEGISREILLNKVNHEKPYKGDHAIQFESYKKRS
jgi:hypothetical protein